MLVAELGINTDHADVSRRTAVVCNEMVCFNVGPPSQIVAQY